MDNPTQTSQRIRPILRAMERSIEDARRKRSGNDAPISSATASPATSPSSTPQSTPTPNANPMALHSATQPALQSIRPQSSESTSNSSGSATPDASNPDQPVRLKARPKRWLSASA